MKKIKYIDIKNILIKNSLEVNSKISDNEEFLKLKSIANASNNDLSFFSNEKYLNNLKNINAKACLIEEKFTKFLPENCEPIIVIDPYLALAIISNIFNDEILNSNGIIAKETSINSKSKIGKNVQINTFTTICENTDILENVYIGSNSNIGPNVLI